MGMVVHLMSVCILTCKWGADKREDTITCVEGKYIPLYNIIALSLS